MIISVDIDTETGLPVGYITTSEAAKRCGISYMGIAKRVQRGTVKSIKLGNSIFVKEDSLDLHTRIGRRKVC